VKIDWTNLAPQYYKTDLRYQAWHKGERWSEGELTEKDTVELSESACVLQYAQTVFEGMKAFRQKSGAVVLFRPELNAERFEKSCLRVCIPPVSQTQFLDAVKKTVVANKHFIPPYGVDASLYIRPFAIGYSPILLCAPAKEYMFRVFTLPFPAVVKNGLRLAVSSFDRAAPRGTGDVKAGLNYAMSFHPLKEAREAGFDYPLHLDPAGQRYIEETNISNILFVTRDKKIVTPKSNSILPSITRKSIIEVARSYLGIECEERKIDISEIADFAECAVCGTAAAITAVASITYNGTEMKFENAGIAMELRQIYKKIQLGEINAPEGWLHEVSL